MAEKKIIELANRYLDAIPKKYKVRGAYIFGSYAKNNQHMDSDIDIAVIVDNMGSDLEADLDFMIARRGIDLRIEPHLIQKKDFNTNNLLVNEVLKYGIRLR